MEGEAVATLDWRDPLLRKELIRRVRRRFDRSQRKRHETLSLDAVRRTGDGDSFPALIDMVRGREDDDPMITLLEREAAAMQPAAVDHPWHHSQATAYADLARRFDNNMERVARFLRLSRSHSYRRFQQAAIPDRERQFMLDVGVQGRTAGNALKPWRRHKIFREPWQLPLDFGAGVDLLDSLAR